MSVVQLKNNTITFKFTYNWTFYMCINLLWRTTVWNCTVHAVHVSTYKWSFTFRVIITVPLALYTRNFCTEVILSAEALGRCSTGACVGPKMVELQASPLKVAERRITSYTILSIIYHRDIWKPQFLCSRLTFWGWPDKVTRDGTVLNLNKYCNMEMLLAYIHIMF